MLHLSGCSVPRDASGVILQLCPSSATVLLSCKVTHNPSDPVWPVEQELRAAREAQVLIHPQVTLLYWQGKAGISELGTGE